MINVEVRNNGSVNHPWYLYVYVDNKLVDKKSFKSKKKAEESKLEYVSELLMKAVQHQRKQEQIARSILGLKEPVVSFSTGHFDD